jgi:hypothetical protein
LEDEGLPQKTHKPEEIVTKLRQVGVLVSQGQSVAEAVRSIGVTQVTCCRWRKEFGVRCPARLSIRNDLLKLGMTGSSISPTCVRPKLLVVFV